MVKVLGVDEAGRGPVIGSLFIVGSMFKEEDIEKLKKLGVKDSKLLTHKKREELRKKIEKIAVKYKIIQIKPQEIDEAVESEDHMNLNWLEAHKTAEILNELKPDKAIIDCPSPNIEKYKGYLKKLLDNQDIVLIVEHKADLNFFPCAASSIIAKCAREDEMDKIKKKYGNTGPGYMSNEITQRFLEENWDKYPEIFRKSWVSWKNHKNKKSQKNLEDFEN
ncbi:ribonuclease HII [Candidatus Woesearchaeota archaeon]|nr:ribonuclease HII [Candidatus Woesearchaeota archaeon]